MYILAAIVAMVVGIVSGANTMCQDVPISQNGTLIIPSEDLSYYDVYCQSGFHIEGQSRVRCIEGRWDSPPPKCVRPNTCTYPDAPENGSMECDKGLLIPGRACRFRCSSGFTLYGVNLRRCMENLQWSGLHPKCVQEIRIFCNVPPQLENGKVIGCSPNKIPHFGTTCSFRCNHGYVLQGPPNLFCRRNGRLSDIQGYERMPECVAVDRLNDKKDILHAQQSKSQNSSESIVQNYCMFNQPCHNGGTCLSVGRNVYTCKCTDEFNGQNCEEPIDPCQKNPCKNGGSCQVDVHSKPEKPICYCPKGYDGPRCEFALHSCNDYCLNNGVCVNIQYKPVCLCRTDFTGERCENKLKGCEQGTGGCAPICNWNGCRCHRGYAVSQRQNICIDINECAHRSLNSCNYGCKNTAGGYTCSCPDGYHKINEYICEACEKGTGGCAPICSWGVCRCKDGYSLSRKDNRCIDINECAYEMKNKCQYRCNNTDGGYTCSCPDGYRQIDAYSCEACRTNSYWLEERKACVDCPVNSYTTSEGKMSVRDCICLSGYAGKPEENIPCQDIDECAVDNFGCSDKCVNTPGSAFCSCPVGYTLDINNKTCIDIDECSIKNGGCQGICHNSDGSFKCSCPEGYSNSNKDHFSCIDKDECLENNGGCAQKCNNYPGGHYCSCHDGFRLDSGLQNCTDIRCPGFPIPHFSLVKCVIGKEVLPNLESYSVGVICNFTCFKGFKNTKSSSIVTCQNDGSWEGEFPECKAQQCHPLNVPENGDIHPSSCSTEGNLVKKTCTFTCQSGYKLQGKPVFKCRSNLMWSEEKIPICQSVKIPPTIKCPEDISADILPGKNSHIVTISSPISNVERLGIEPAWVSIEVPIEFPAGKTDVIFKASDPNSDRIAECITSVEILDKEHPVFTVCPESIQIESTDPDGVLVTWRDPVATDNVNISSLESTLEPNSVLTPGTYIVEYIAKDNAGNTASCTFDITVSRIHCDNLDNPANGSANCMDWLTGKICTPTCYSGFARHPKDPALYICGGSGTWEPSDTISECLKSVPAVSSKCKDGYELTENSETGEEICVECPKYTLWSASTGQCEETT